ncbi:MAG: saccharopine dehydrogenase family protein [Bacteroidia bacterium]|nr:saccharopine dehydrogenase family protein [Bacteroidia bacterium]MCX7651786.1 saccharopine dehydrogenase family protein [Bacteroidia bacterium]MDW8416342.1 saccharopine dehydrogenase family protein [Bacteroidia bacterium]
MPKVMVVGAGAVAQVTMCKLARRPDLFPEIVLASRTFSKCKAIAEKHPQARIIPEQLDADDVSQTVALLKKHKPALLLNLALPYQDLALMEACLEAGVDYLDTASYEPPDIPFYEYKYQWAYHERYERAGISAVLGIGFDPGVTNAFVAYAAKHLFDEIHYLDIIDCNAGDHGRPFATNFNLEINLREITQTGRYYLNGEIVEVPPLSVAQDVRFPEIGVRKAYLIFHEELESLVKHFPSLRRARFWMTFSEKYLMHLNAFVNAGLTRIDPVDYEGCKIVPIKFLQRLLPDPASLAPDYKGWVSIGVQLRGIKDGQERTAFIYTNIKHEWAYADCGAQAVAYTAGVPPAIAAELIVSGSWKKPGVWNVEQLPPEPLLERLPAAGLPWKVVVDYPLDFTDIPE